MKILIAFFIIFIIYSINPENGSLKFLNIMLDRNENAIDKNLASLSGGTLLLRDDPANYVIYEKLESQIRELDKKINNNEDMISYYNYMGAILSGTIEILQNIREILIQEESGILSQSDKDILNSQIKENYLEMDYNIKQAEFNKVRIFSDLLGNKEFQNYFDNAKFYNIKNIDDLINFNLKQMNYIGTLTNRLEYQIKGDAVNKVNSIDFKSHGDTDYAAETSELKKNYIMFTAKMLMLGF